MSKAIETIGKQLNIAELSDWEQVSPHEVLRLPRAGNATLDKVTLLANLLHTARRRKPGLTHLPT